MKGNKPSERVKKQNSYSSIWIVKMESDESIKNMNTPFTNITNGLKFLGKT